MRDHTSCSQVITFAGCQMQFYFSYIEGIKIPPSISLLSGTSVHAGADYNFTEKLKTGNDEPLSVLQDVVAEAYEKESEDGFFVSNEEKASASNLYHEGKDKAVKLIEPLRNDFAPTIQPILVEERFEIQVNDMPIIVGYPDLYGKDVETGAVKLVDIKTSASKWRKGKEESEIQPTVYPQMLKAHGYEVPEEFSFELLIKTKEPRHETITTKRNDDDFWALVKRMQAMERQIENGDFLPAEPGHWRCSEKWCGYWYMCPYVPNYKKNKQRK